MDAGARHPDERFGPPRDLARIALADFVLYARE
jgi:hypothetical protein